MGESLSRSATNYRAHWSGPKDHVFPRTWEYNGYQLIDISLEDQRAIFEKKTRSERRLEIIIDVINGLGGTASYPDIYRELTNKSEFYLDTLRPKVIYKQLFIKSSKNILQIAPSIKVQIKIFFIA